MFTYRLYTLGKGKAQMNELFTPFEEKYAEGISAEYKKRRKDNRI
jgi:hypothetical protein